MARILLVDDDKDIRDFGCALLAKAGHETFAVDSVINALEFLRLHRVDLLITDANMPQHTGFDLIRTIKKDPKQNHLVVAMLTGRRERKDIERAVELGVHDYIIKPIDPTLFLSKVSDLLENQPADEVPATESFAQLKLFATAKATVAIELVAVSEAGLVFRSPHKFEDGARIEIDTDLFSKMGVTAPLLRVNSTSAAPEGSEGFDTRIGFVGADERILTKIRAWVHANTAAQGKRRSA